MESVIDLILVDVILRDVRWSREYIIYREFGHRSVFGEESITDLTSNQSRLLSLSQLYDVVRNTVSMHNSYGEEKAEIPNNILPYPRRLMKWYEEWQKKTSGNRNKTDGKGKQDRSRRGTTIFADNESDAEAFAAYMAARRAQNANNK